MNYIFKIFAIICCFLASTKGWGQVLNKGIICEDEHIDFNVPDIENVYINKNAINEIDYVNAYWFSTKEHSHDNLYYGHDLEIYRRDVLDLNQDENITDFIKYQDHGYYSATEDTVIFHTSVGPDHTYRTDTLFTLNRYNLKLEKPGPDYFTYASCVSYNDKQFFLDRLKKYSRGFKEKLSKRKL